MPVTPTNVFMGSLKPQAFNNEPPRSRLQQTDFPQAVVKQRSIEDGLFGIKFGLAADRPETGDQYRAYFATDTFILSCWTGTAWVSGIAFT